MTERPFTAMRLFLLGFLTLFLELTLIRYLAGNVWNMGFFPNLVLMGVFIGMGIGFVFHHRISEQHSPHFFQLSAMMLLVLVGFVYWEHPHVPGFSNNFGTIGGELYFTSTPTQSGHLSFLLFGLIFVLVILIFCLLSQRTAKYFRLFTPLKAYTLDILGSCFGILSFMLVSWLQVPAFLWFSFLILLFCLIQESNRFATIVVLGIVVLLAGLSDQQLLSDPSVRGARLQVKWSPYQKVESVSQEDGQNSIFVNGISHQTMITADIMNRSIYILPYQYRIHGKLPPSADVLVIGAGSGNDVAAALLGGAQHVDAVEIDPVIANLGRGKHPLHPYQDPRVTQVVDDARAFMTYTTRHYDVIIFALTDSLVKVSPVAQLRLENYIFTEESVRRAQTLLKDGGTIFFYNYYRLPWVKEKIQQMSHDAGGFWPRTVYQSHSFAMLALDHEHPGTPPQEMEEGLAVPRDDWPFLYLKRREIPSIYQVAMIGIASLIALLALLLHRTSRSMEAEGQDNTAVKLAFLFMGTAFLLLETKSVIQFSLLFGTTWINNSLVFLSVLLFVLAANWVATLLSGPRVLWITYVLLMVFCLIAFLFPLGRLLAVQSVMTRFAVASLLTFSPIFFANVIFSVTFRDRKVAEHLFGWNLIGAAFGGILEYSSMALGYNALAIIVAACYTLVFILLRLEHRHG